MSLWITYAWTDNQEGNFDYLVGQLGAQGIQTRYDRIQLVPGQRLWEQIGARISDNTLRAWAYLITPNSLQSQPCREELEYAVNRAIQTKNNVFPLIGLVTAGVSFNDVPISLRVRLCVSLSSPNWIEEIRAGLELRPPRLIDTPQTMYIYRVTQEFNGTNITTVIEIRPRFNEVHFWRVALPTNCTILNFGVGPANSRQTTGILQMVTQGGTGELNGHQVQVVGAGTVLTPGTSAFVFINGTPDFVAFGTANEAFGMPTQMEIQNLR
ncbi:MAG: toll/interleukin-1 receptor domain-containing protein [Bacteroidetes bacterium]|nr:toll/interleukin-1 receptor domain-containing protein [Bacteroidota bacterium]